MTTSTPEHDALKRAVLDTIIPQDTVSSITEILDEPEDDEDSSQSSLINVKQRNLLFFGRYRCFTPDISCSYSGDR